MIVLTTSITPTIIVEIIGIASSILFVMAALAANLKLRSRNGEMFMQKRNPRVVYILNAALLSAIIGFQCTINVSLHTDSSVAIMLSLSIMFVSMWSVFCILLTRSWILYFKIHWTTATLRDDTQKWHRLLNRSCGGAEAECAPNWFIVHHGKYGRTKRMYKIFAVWCGVGCALCIVASALVLELEYDSSLYAVTLSTMVPVILLYALLVFKSDSTGFDDHFLIHYEQRAHSKLLLLMAAAMVLTIAFRLMFPHSTMWIAFTPISNALWFAMLWVSSHTVSSKNRAVAALQSRHRRRTVSEVSRSGTGSGGGITVDAVLSNEAAISLFMGHLSREYSVEVLTSYIEMMQFQNWLMESVSLALHFKIKQSDLPPTIPISEIVQRDDSAKEKAHAIWAKYIATDSEYEINISSAEKGRFYSILGDADRLLSADDTMTKEQLFFLFEPCKMAMIQLLQYSLSRMKHQPQYAKMVQIFDESEREDTV